ncbi:hypothetical protein EDEG_00595 [Edhazardia aedis USNM 41457]|uniref:Uncharacterized protein n=1 Tax=Edhazardia aedis (strain USNM 41457) TaxID=1003232 RepID=J9DD20_EDHAE|nr:hypothetical protein EDEG_00595 [Edhazardia aedis USNM 41457]|eukprot:EJW05369.1 hypothetical protein EDEG_00595 [Edhazardia aedis USNM 41457]
MSFFVININTNIFATAKITIIDTNIHTSKNTSVIHFFVFIFFVFLKFVIFIFLKNHKISIWRYFNLFLNYIDLLNFLQKNSFYFIFYKYLKTQKQDFEIMF